MASAPTLREEEKGREGAAAQPPGLFCVGRLPLPVSVPGVQALQRQQQRVGVATVECPWLLPAGPGKGVSDTAASQCPIRSF